MSRKDYFVVEHPSRGVFLEMKGDKPRFSYSCLRSDGVHFHRYEDAVAKMKEINNNLRKMKCYVINMFNGVRTTEND